MLTLVSMFVLSTTFTVAPDLLPPPQQVTWREGVYLIPRELRVSIPEEWKGTIESYLWILDESLAPKGYFRISCVAPSADPAISIEREESVIGREEGYTLDVNSDGIRIGASQPSGIFNGLATLSQLVEQSMSEQISVPACQIQDWSELPLRAVHIDMTAQQFTPQYIQMLMRNLARYKINAILMEYSAMFPYRKHRAICLPDAFTEADIRAIRQTAKSCNQELIPFLQCLGHLDYMLHVPEYTHYGKRHGFGILCPSSDEALPLVRELIDEIFARHPDVKYLHIGGDEVSPGSCEKCLAYLKDHTFSDLYMKHYTGVVEHCKGHYVKPLMWSDIALKHPESLTKLPRDVGWVVWDYTTSSDPCQSIPHGASMRYLDKLKPEYVKYFGDGIGLSQAGQRGGLKAFGHTVGFMDLGFSAFAGPAARFGGDSFALPRVKLHMLNIRLACLKAVEYKLPGVIITSWSYRGSPHEMCLPEYVCASYGWNTSTSDIEILLSQFFRLRYGINGDLLVKTVLEDLSFVPPSTMAIPKLVDTKRAWMYPVSEQLEQIKKRVLQAEPDQQLAFLQTCLNRLKVSSALWNTAITSAKRNSVELRQWDLSRRHMIHRIRLNFPLTHLMLASEVSRKQEDQQISQWKQELELLTESRQALRAEWAELYRHIPTSRFLEVELEQRFDAEQGMIDSVLSGL